MDQQPEEAIHAGWKKRFFTIWTGQAFSLFGSNLVQFALVWYITSTTGSATVLATATLVAMLPQIIFGPFAGALVDRWNRRLVMMVADGLIAVVSLLLAVLFYTGSVQIWHIFLVMAIRSVGTAFHWPAMQASTSLLVPHNQLSRVAGINQSLFGIMNIVAPPLGALLLAAMPVGGILLIDVVTASIAVFALSLVTIPQPARSQTTAGFGIMPVLQDMKLGFRYMAGWPGLLALGGLAMVINFFATPAFSLIPILVTKHFGGGAIQLGMMNSAYGIGFVIGGVMLSVWGGFRKGIYTSFVGLAGMGLGILLMGFAPANLFWMGVGALALAGFMNPITNGPIFAVFQKSIVPEMQGRVLSLISSTAALISPLSLLVAGPVADAIGIRSWYWIAGAASLLMAVIGLSIPAIINIEEQGKELIAAHEAAFESPPAGQT